MNEINEEIRQTILALNQENAQPIVEELQCHLANLFDMVRDELQRRLNERSWSEPSIGIAKQVEAPYKSVKLDGQTADEAKPLTVDELMAGGWWCADISEDCANALKSKNLRVFNSYEWGNGEPWGSCALDSDGEITRGFFDVGNNKKIHRIGNQFFWSDDK